MNLCKGDVFTWRGSRWRLLEVDPSTRGAWVIKTCHKKAWPEPVSMRALESVEREPAPVAQPPLAPSAASAAKLEADYKRLQRVLDAGVGLFDRDVRREHLAHLSKELGCSPRTLASHLRRYWQRGMTKSALMPEYKNCGRREAGATAGRGAKSKSGHAIYQVGPDDHACMNAALDAYHADSRLSLAAAYQYLVNNFYVVEDGNGNRHLREPGELPTLRQFTYYYQSRYPLEAQLRKRFGDKEYQKAHKPKLSDTMADCVGVGHCYEIDATIVDVQIVHSTDRKTIIGKPTLFLLVDRKSRLITGYYVGLENPCWETAAEALVSLVESKQALCERYGVEYDPDDWPADGILPAELLCDNSEMLSRASSQLSQALGVTVQNTASLMPNFKPNVETRFKMLTTDLRSMTPGYEPPENFGKRRTKSYDKEVCLTLHELIAEILEAIIKHNRTVLRAYRLSADQILRGVEPSPIGLWNDGLRQTGCLGRRFDERVVYTSLLPTDNASITHEGLLFKKLYYTADDPALQNAFIRAKSKRARVTVSYDRRSVDAVYVHLGDTLVRATLSERSRSWAGLSVREVAEIHLASGAQARENEHKRLQTKFESDQRREARILAAERERDKLGSLSVQARKKDTVSARRDEKHRQRKAQAARRAEATDRVAQPEAPGGRIAGLPINNRPTPDQSQPLTAAQLARRKMG